MYLIRTRNSLSTFYITAIITTILLSLISVLEASRATCLFITTARTMIKVIKTAAFRLRPFSEICRMGFNLKRWQTTNSYNKQTYVIIFIHHKMAAIIIQTEKATNKQNLTKENNYLRYCDNFNKNLSVRVGMISLRSLKSKYTRHSFTVSLLDVQKKRKLTR